MVIPSNIDELSVGSTVVGIVDDVVRYESLACSVAALRILVSRGAGHSAVTSATAARALESSTLGSPRETGVSARALCQCGCRALKHQTSSSCRCQHGRMTVGGRPPVDPGR